MAAICLSLFLAGWNDGSTGPLLPRIQQVYRVSYGIVSLLFLSSSLGFILGGVASVYFVGHFGFGKVSTLLGSLIQIVGYCIQAPGPPFPAFVIAFFLNGFAESLQCAQANGYVASFKVSSSKLGLVHCAYGTGALAAPLVSTQFAQLPRWSFHYLVSLGVACMNTCTLLAVFRLKMQDDCLREVGEEVAERGQSKDNVYKQILRLKSVHLIALFMLMYVGVEVTIGGWIVSYIISVRGGGSSSGYISSGFFGGLALGRIGLLWVTKKLGNRLAVFLYIVIATGLELIVWLVPSLISGAIAISIVGLLIGPIYPIVVNEASHILPGWLLSGSIGWIAGVATTGAAALPFIAGQLAQEKGIWSLQPLLISMMASMTLLWLIIPKGHQRVE
ncbi:MFS general substrate transporter [Dentipellis sp. KUC8613]|nr:MFS general substrate transporter [Dentipellis sp. KUC8613]